MGLQIKEGSDWLRLLAYEEPEELTDYVALEVLDDPTMKGFQAATKAASEKRVALFRVNDEDMGAPFWVDISRAISLKADRMMTVSMSLARAPESDT